MRRLGTIAIAILGLWSLIQSVALLNLPISVLGLGQEGLPPLAAPLSFVPLAVSLALGVLLISGRAQLARRWFDEEPLELPVEGLMLLRLGLMLLGVSLLVGAVPSLVGALLNPLITPLQEQAMFGQISTGVNWIAVLPRVIDSLLEIAIGLALVLGSERLSRRLWLGRAAAAPVQAPAKDETLPRCPSCGEPYDATDYREDAVDRRCVNCGAPLGGGSA